MRLGISSYSYPWAVGVGDVQPRVPLNALQLIERAVHLRVRVLQLADGLALHLLSAREIDAIAEAASRVGLTLEVGTRATDRESLVPYLRIAQLFSAPLLRVVMRTADRQLSIDETIALVREVLPDAERFGVCLGIETHESLRSEQLLGIMRTIDSPHLGVVYDTANSLGCSESAEDVLGALAEHIVNYHVKDVRIRRISSGFGFLVEGTVAGAGDLDLPGLTARIQSLTPRKAVPEINAIIEHWPPFDESIDKTVAIEERWTAESVRYMRRWVTD
jgi:3-oxoisoapionate decarboxylase